MPPSGPHSIEPLSSLGCFPPSLGAAYGELVGLRNTGDYGGPNHVAPLDAVRAVEHAERMIEAMAGLAPELARP